MWAWIYLTSLAKNSFYVLIIGRDTLYTSYYEQQLLKLFFPFLKIGSTFWVGRQPFALMVAPNFWPLSAYGVSIPILYINCHLPITQGVTLNMGSSESKFQDTKQSQANDNQIIDQSVGAAFMQFNWASIGSDISSVFITSALLLLLCFCYHKNKCANRKAQKAELHETISLASRGCYVSTSQDSPGQTGIYPPSSGYPGPRPSNQPGNQLNFPHFCNPAIANYSAGNSFCNPGGPSVAFPGLLLSGLFGICLLYTSPSPRD